MLRPLVVLALILTTTAAHALPAASVGRAAVLDAGLEPPVFFDVPTAAPLPVGDPLLASQYGLAQIRALDVVGATAEDVLVCVIDSGLRTSHDELRGQRVVATRDFIVDPEARDGLHYHGTFVTSLAGGASGNGAGIAGLVDVALAHGRGLNETGWGYTSEIVAAMHWCADLPLARHTILSISIVDYTDEGGLYAEAIAYARARGAIVVASAGNEGSVTPGCLDCVMYPAAAEGAIAVASTSPGEVPSWWSSFGPEVDIAAPGDVIVGAASGSDSEYTAFSGTSFSAPIVAAALALAWSIEPELTGDELTARLYATAQDVATPGRDIFSGHGELDVRCLLAGVPPCDGVS